MHLVDEEDIELLQAGQDRGEIARTFDRRTGGDAHGDTHFGGDDVGECGLAEAGRAVEEDVVERFFAFGGGLDGDAEVVLELLLADELIKATRPKGRVQRFVFVFLDLAVGDAVFSGRRTPPVLRFRRLSNVRSTRAIIWAQAALSRGVGGADQQRSQRIGCARHMKSVNAISTVSVWRHA